MENETHRQPGEISSVEASNRKLLFRTVAALEKLWRMIQRTSGIEGC